MRRTGWLLLLILGLLAACGPRPAEGFSFREVDFSLNGGIVGFSQQVVVEADGSFHRKDRESPWQEGRLNGDDLELLQARLAVIDWPTLQSEYPDHGVADAIRFSLVVVTPARRHQVAWRTGSPVPQSLTDLLETLQQLFPPR